MAWPEQGPSLAAVMSPPAGQCQGMDLLVVPFLLVFPGAATGVWGNNSKL
jgi:hypothetical protein